VSLKVTFVVTSDKTHHAVHLCLQSFLFSLLYGYRICLFSMCIHSSYLTWSLLTPGLRLGQCIAVTLQLAL